MYISQDWEGYLIHQRVMLSFRRTSGSWKMFHKTVILRNSAKGRHLEEKNSMETCKDQVTGRQCWWTACCTWLSHMPWEQSRPVASCTALGMLPRAPGTWSFHSTQHWWSLTWSAASSAGLPSTRERGQYWRESSERLLRWLRDWTIQLMRKSCKGRTVTA